MSNKPDIAERIGTAINELDIDFSRFTFVGWFTSLSSLGVGGGVAYLACNAMIRRSGLNLPAGMTFCLTMIAVTTIMFLALRWSFGLAGLAVTKSIPVSKDSNNANRDTLKRMANAGMDMKAVHAIDFWHLFKTRDDAEIMGRKARQESFNVVSIEPNDESGGFDVQIQVELVPTLNAINTTEQTLAVIADQCNGHADGWGVRQKS
jgi:regulator of RNase E activity RraB